MVRFESPPPGRVARTAPSLAFGPLTWSCVLVAVTLCAPAARAEASLLRTRDIILPLCAPTARAEADPAGGAASAVGTHPGSGNTRSISKTSPGSADSNTSPEGLPEVGIQTGTGAAHSTAGTAPGSPDSVIDEAVELLDQGEVDEAGRLVTAAVMADPRAGGLALVFARELGQRNRFDEAIDFLRNHMEQVPNNHRAAVELGVLLSSRLEHDEAAAYFARVPPDAGEIYLLAHLNLGRALRLLGRFSEARDLYLGLLDSPSADVAEISLCEIEMAAGELDACRTRLALARLRLGDGRGFDRADATLAYLAGDLDRARSLLDRLLDEGTPSSRLAALTVLIPLARGRLDDATQALESLRTVSVLGEAHAMRTAIAMARGDLDTARDARGLAIERNPLFLEPARAAQILLWRPEVAEALESLSSSDSSTAGTGSSTTGTGSSAAGTGSSTAGTGSSAAGTGSSTAGTAGGEGGDPGSNTEEAAEAQGEIPSSGCCHLAATRHSSPSALGWPLIILVLGGFRRFHGPGHPPGSG